MTVYRVIRGEVEIPNMQSLSSEVIWEGTSLGELSTKFPRIYFTNGDSLDQLRPIKQSERVVIVTAFLRKVANGRWERIKDPRPLQIREPYR
jgi:hypothetical protein